MRSRRRRRSKRTEGQLGRHSCLRLGNAGVIQAGAAHFEGVVLGVVVFHRCRKPASLPFLTPSASRARDLASSSRTVSGKDSSSAANPLNGLSSPSPSTILAESGCPGCGRRRPARGGVAGACASRAARQGSAARTARDLLGQGLLWRHQTARARARARAAASAPTLSIHDRAHACSQSDSGSRVDPCPRAFPEHASGRG